MTLLSFFYMRFYVLMSMVLTHYVGFYLKCDGQKNGDQESLFPDESMYSIYDEGGCADINNYHIYVPNRECPGCYCLNRYSDTGILDFDATRNDIPEMISKAEVILRSAYEMVELKYGVVSYVN